MTSAPDPGPQVLELPRTKRLAGTGDRVQGPLAGCRGGAGPAHRVCLCPAETVTYGTQGHTLVGFCGLGNNLAQGHPSWGGGFSSLAQGYPSRGQASSMSGSAFLES